MKFTETSVAGVEILDNDHYVGVPITLTADAKAGAPIAEAGGAGSDTDVVGILLHDVTIADNPVGTIVVHGFIRTAAAQTHSGVTVTDAMKKLLPMVLFV